MEKIKQFVYQYNIVFAIILLIAILVRVVLLDKYPEGIHEDEAGMMYDAYCMAEYGTDRYLNENPVYLINFGGGQSVLYAVIASVFIRIFGFSVLVTRLPAVIFSVITIILAYFLTKKYIGKKFATVFSFLIAICPWHIMQSRWGLDCNLLSSFIMISVFTFLNSKKTWHFIISGIFCGLMLYTYALSYIILPVFFIGLCMYLLYVKKITIKEVLVTLIPILILAVPLILVQVVNYFGLESIQIGFITIPKLFTYRIGEIGLENIVYNLNIGNANNFFQLLFSADHNPGNAFQEWGTIYYMLIPFVILGFILTIKETITSIKNKQFNVKTVFLIQLILVTFSILVFADLQLYKLNPLFIMMLALGAESIIWLYNKRKFFAHCVIMSLSITFILFVIFYFKNINQKAGVGFNTDFMPLIEYLDTQYPNTEIYLETDAIQQYIYLLLYKKMSPYEFMENMSMIQYKTGETEVIQVGKYHFILYGEIDKNTVYVLEENNAFRPKTIQKLKEKLEEQGFTQEKYQQFLIYTFNE